RFLVDWSDTRGFRELGGKPTRGQRRQLRGNVGGHSQVESSALLVKNVSTLLHQEGL
ncbi:hypothetical protein AVEN_7566-1, partial [Araneus ventricosus]